jgi:hypothetical protein
MTGPHNEVTELRTFLVARHASLLLPDGWFGAAPSKVLHELTHVYRGKKRLLLELDGHVLLSFVGPETRVYHTASNAGLSAPLPAICIDQFRHLTFESVAYGNGRVDTRSYTSGSVCLVVPT